MSYRIITDNGMELVHLWPTSNFSRIVMFVKTDPTKIDLAHLVEHILFQKKLPNGKILFDRLNNLGNTIGCTMTEGTYYQMDVDDYYFIEAFNLMLQVYLLDESISHEELEEIKRVMFIEFNSHSNSTKLALLTNIHLLSKTKIKLTSKSVLNNLASYTKSDVINYYQNNYVPNKTTIMLVGRFNADQYFRIITKTLNKNKNLGEYVHRIPNISIDNREIILADLHDSIEIVINFPVILEYGYILTALLRKIFINILRMKLNLVYSPHIYCGSLSETHGLFEILFTSSPKLLIQTLKEIKKIFSSLSVDEDLFDVAQDKALTLFTGRSLVEVVVSGIYYQNFTDNTLHKIRMVTRDKFLDFCKTLDLKNMNVYIMGKLDKKILL